MITADPPCQAHLHDADAGHHPGDISGRQAAIDKAMQLVRLGDLDPFILVLEAEQKLGGSSETRGFRDP